VTVRGDDHSGKMEDYTTTYHERARRMYSH
ncbi:unnamed protein product, partial [Aureobasidium pullulans]